MWKALNESLHSLRLEDCHKLVALPKGIQRLISLKELSVQYYDNLETIPEWIGNLKSLQTLQLRNCPQLASLPGGIRSLISLKELEIFYCPILLKICKRKIGEDWLKSAHIPQLRLIPDPNEDYQKINRMSIKQLSTR